MYLNEERGIGFFNRLQCGWEANKRGGKQQKGHSNDFPGFVRKKENMKGGCLTKGKRGKAVPTKDTRNCLSKGGIPSLGSTRDIRS